MKNSLRLFTLLFSLSLACFGANEILVSKAHAQTFLDTAGLSPYTHYKTFETEHFIFIYQEGYWDFTARAAEHIEHAHAVLSPILQWQPRYKTTILIADNEDSANGFTMPALRVGIVLIATPPDAWFSTSYSDDWIKLLVFHEYTHFLNIDPTRGFMEVARIFFGDIIRPNGLWPTWMLEGLAVYYETRTSNLGRGRSPYYEGILRAYVNENRLGTSKNHGMTLDRVNSGDQLPYFPGGEIPYLFGYHLWDEFSKDHALHADTDLAMGDYSFHSSRRFPYLIEGNLQNVMGKHWHNYWESFVADSKTRMGKEIDAVKKNGETKSDLLTKSQYSSYLGAISPDGQWLAYTENSLNDQPRLVMLNLKTKQTRRLDEKVLGVGMSFTPDSKFLIFSSLVRTNTYSLFSDLYIYDIEKDATHQITTALRAKDPSISPDGMHVAFIQSDKATNYLRIAELKHDGGNFSLGELKTPFQSTEFSILSTPRFISNDEVVFSKQEIGHTEADLVVTSISKNTTRTLIADGAMNRYPTFSNGNIYFVSDRSGIENVYSIPSTGGSANSITNVITGVSLPRVAPDGSLYGSLITSDGYEIAHFADTHAMPLTPKVATPEAPAPLADALKEPTLHLGQEDSQDYSPFGSLAPRQWAPVALVSYNTYSGTSIEGTILGFDSTGKHQYFGYAGYNFLPNTVDGAFSYTYYGFRPVITLSASSLTTDIATDLDQAQYRNSSQVMLNLSYPIRYTHSSLTPSVYGFVDWNRVYDIHTKQQLSTDDYEYANPMVPGLGVSLQFSDAETSRLGFMSEDGNDFVVAAEDRVDVNQFSVIKYLASYSHYFGLGDHFVLVPTAKLLASTHPAGEAASFDDTYARFSGRNSTDVYDRGTGLSLNEIELRGYAYEYYLTRQVGVGSLDFHFPIAKPYRGVANTGPFFLKQLHGFIYGESGFVPLSGRNLFLPSFGGGLSADTEVLLHVPVTINIEVQNGTQTQYGGETLFFLSLQAGSLF
jgi:hypothetical protein